MKTLHSIILGLFVTSLVTAQTPTGTLQGTVRDAETGNPLEGANVIVRGTFLGAATNREGAFKIQGLSGGAYTVIVSMVGYVRFTAGIRVSPEEPASLDVQLRPTPILTEQIVVTASRREQQSGDVPASLSVITSSALAQRNIVTMDDALRYVPGVNMMQDQVNIRGSSGYSRGVGSRVLLLLDGLPFLTGDTGEINWETIPVGEVERVEVIKGASSALYGSSALGGVINVLTKPLPDEPQFRFRMFSGLYEKPAFQEWDWSSGPRLNSGVFLGYAGTTGSLQYLLSGGRTVDESFKENDAYHRWSVFTKAQYDFSAHQRLSLVFNMLNRKHGNFFWWKNLREATKPAEMQRNGSVTGTRGNLSVGFRETISEDFFYEMKGIYFGNFWKDDSAGHVNNVSSSHAIHAEIQMTSRLSEGNILTFGVAGNRDQVFSNLFGNQDGLGFAAYVQEELEFVDSFNLTAGVRYDVQKASALRAAGRLSPKVGVTYELTSDVTLRGSMGTGFRYPSIGELFIASSMNISSLVLLPNLNLRPEKSLTAELGISARPSEILDIDAAVFWNEFDDLIEPAVKIKNIFVFPSDTVPTNRAVVEFENVTRARIQGAEVNARVSWFRKVLDSEMGYTILWPEDLAQHAVLKFRPRHMVHVSTTATVGAVSASADYRFISRVDRIDDQLVQLAPIIHGQYRVPIHVVDVRGSLNLSGLGLPFRVGVNVNNILNYQYVELVGNLGPPRTYTIVVEGSL